MQIEQTFSAPLPSVRLNRMTGLLGQQHALSVAEKESALMLKSLWAGNPDTCCTT